MPRLVYADADHYASGRTRAKRRAADLEFLARIVELRAAGDTKALSAMLRDHANGPEWKQVAIKRAIKHAVMSAERSTGR